MKTNTEANEFQPTSTDVRVHIAAQFSTREARRYASSHAWQRGYPNFGDATVLSTARFQALLDAGRRELAGQFSRDDIVNMVNGLGKCMFTPEDLMFLDVEFAESLPGDAAEADEALVQRLGALSPMARFALGDALEWMMHEGQAQKLSVEQCCEFLQLSLKD